MILYYVLYPHLLTNILLHKGTITYQMTIKH
jgi:hypothetical protein